MKRVLDDLALGVRLAVGGGRESWARQALTGVGIGLGVVLLFVAAAIPSIMANRDARQDARLAENPAAGTPAERVLHSESWYSAYRDHGPIAGKHLLAGGPQAPVPPGIPEIPADGEMYVSPALAELLADPDNAVLRERFPQRVVGTIADEGLITPHDLAYFAGDASVVPTAQNAVGRFGVPSEMSLVPPFLLVLGLTGCVVLLFPVLVFIGVSTRLAGAQRDRRLAALRLVGASAGRVRLIASGEALVGALVGLALGGGLFLLARRHVEEVELVGMSVFAEDLTPAPALVALLVALVPALAVVTALVAMRRTVVEPLGVVRQTRPARRKLWWRALPVVAGVALLASQAGAFAGRLVDGSSQQTLVAGITLLLFGVPALLPWALERSVRRAHRGAPSWQLAMRRLQLDSGTAARVVGGVAVVLAGAIALQSVLTNVERAIPDGSGPRVDESLLTVASSGRYSITPAEDAGLRGRAVELLDGVAGVERVFTPEYAYVRSDEVEQQVVISDCAMLLARGVPECVDGAAYSFHLEGQTPYWQVAPGSELTVLPLANAATIRTDERGRTHDDRVPLGTWRAPEARQVALPSDKSDLYGLHVTPGAARDLPRAAASSGGVIALLDGRVPEAADNARTALAPLAWKLQSHHVGTADLSEEAEQYRQVRGGLFAGSLLTLLLAAGSLLVVALEQIKERRRPLAALFAGGVPRGVLARSLLWQNAVPLVLAVLVAIATGAGLGALLLRTFGRPVELDWAGIGQYSALALVLGLLVTALTLPSLRRATDALGLRAE
ncbi:MULTISPECIES: FtsX-like permease family protein [Actinosynnema]|uniref:FtsX-like permease family protein n=1 Tax=Actinosynnema TaxID=40566 RepID=UPI0020A5DB41|nr:FtsX-like permease family protein [Actinosynnema pretiosum]MCP2093819.1 FtsX-like permease family protein [Actinosynnema pretiosum]